MCIIKDCVGKKKRISRKIFIQRLQSIIKARFVKYKINV